MTTILPLQQNQPLVDVKTGYFTPFLKRYMDQLLARVGGILGFTFTNLPVLSSTFVWDFNMAPQASVTLTNGVNTLSPPLNLVAGGFYRLTIIQPSSGAAGTISWPRPPVLFSGATPPTLSLANNAIDECWFSCDGNNVKLMVFAKNLS